MSGLPRPLLPMPTGDDRKRLTYITQNDTTLKTKRSLILAACEVCRKKKARVCFIYNNARFLTMI
jgi:hypothetical protein